MKKHFTRVLYLLAACLVMSTSPMFGQTYFGDSVGDPVPDIGTSGSFESVASVPVSGEIGVNASIDAVTVDLLHTFDGDLDISLVAPSGTSIILSDQNGGAGDNYLGTSFVDGFPSIGSTGSPPFAGTFGADGGSMNAVFAGECITGDWTLAIEDNFAGDSGTFLGFSITFTTTGEACTAPPVLDDCTAYSGDSEGDPLPDIGTSGSFVSEIPVAGTGTIGANAAIESVILDLDHTFDGDLEIDLVAPSGTRLTLSENNGGAGDDYENTTFADGFPTIGGSAPFAGTFEPDGGPFSAAFGGESITGTWRLEIVDEFAGDSGTFGSVTLNICTSGETDPCDPDVEGPMAVCKNGTVELDPYGFYFFTENDVLDFGASFDNCGFSVSIINPGFVTCDNVFTTVPVTVVITDTGGNTASCTANMYVDKGDALPGGWDHDSVGGATGDAYYDPCEEVFCLESNGISHPISDKIYFAHKYMCGDGSIEAHVISITNGGLGGIEFRDDLSGGSKVVALRTQLAPFVHRDVRAMTNGYKTTQQLFKPNHSYLKLERIGNLFKGYTSMNGISWTFAFFTTVNMSECVYVGLFAEGPIDNTISQVCFDEVYCSGENGGELVELPDGPVANSARANTGFSVFPNPATDIINADLGSFIGQKVDLMIYNELGQMVKQIQIDEVQLPTEQIQLDGLQSGPYYIEARTDLDKITQKFIIVK